MGEALSEACGETLVPVGEPTAMLAIFMCVFVRPELAATAAPLYTPLRLPAHYTHEAADALAKAGHAEQAATMHAKVGQKGGVALGVRLGGGGAGDCGGGGGINFIVLATHLPAGDKDSSTVERDHACEALRKRAIPADVEARLTLNEQAGGEETVFVIVGGVNSRTRGLEPAEARALGSGSEAKGYRTIMEHDELCCGAAIYGHTMCEAAITWAPSYKFKKGKYDEKRAPSYCDRVLWDDGSAHGKVFPRLYACSHEVMISDHKPVTAVLSVTLPQKQGGARTMAAPKHVPSMQATEQRRPSIDSSLDSNNGGKAAGTAAAAGQKQKGAADPKEVNLQPKGPAKRGCTCTVL